VYACGEATNGRLGLGLSTGTISVPRLVTSLSQYVIKKVAVHSGLLNKYLNLFYCSNISNGIGHKLLQHYKCPLPTIYNIINAFSLQFTTL